MAFIYLTKQQPNSTSQGGYEPDELEITPAMVEAGASMLLEMSSDEFSNFNRAEATFEAMLAAAPVASAR